MDCEGSSSEMIARLHDTGRLSREQRLHTRQFASGCLADEALPLPRFQSRFLGRGCDEALFSERKAFFSEKGGGNSGAFHWKGGRQFSEWGVWSELLQGMVRISTGKAIQWRGPGHPVNRRTLKTEKLLNGPRDLCEGRAGSQGELKRVTRKGGFNAQLRRAKSPIANR